MTDTSDLVARWRDYVESMGSVMGEAEELAQQMANHIETLEAKLAKAVEALEEIAKQMRTDELETEYDVEYADFDGGYDACIDRARATLRELKGGGA